MKFSQFYTFVGVLGILIVIIPFHYKYSNNKLTGMFIINEGIVQDKVVRLKYTTVTTQNTTGVPARRFPDAIIIGGKKCGTTVLRDMLSHHHLIKIAKKEMFYFSNSDRYKLGISWYINQMPLTKEGELTLEKSPQYFTSTVAPERLKRVSTGVKLMLILRNPLSRSISDYFFMQRKGRQTTTFTKKLFPNRNINTKCSEIRTSMYDINYSKWLKWFPKEQILIVNGDNLKINPIEELTKIEKFLNIPHYFENDMFQFTGRRYYWKDPDSKKHYVGIQHKLPDVPQDTLYEVAMFLQPHASKFCQMASVNYTWCTDILADRMTWNSTTKISGTLTGNSTTKISNRLTLNNTIMQ